MWFTWNLLQYDSFSMFDGQYPGAGSATLSFITLFAVAEALGKVRNELLNATDKHILLVIFHGVSSSFLDCFVVYNNCEFCYLAFQRLRLMMMMMICWCACDQEAFDYIGSSRMAYDMRKGKMNFTVEDIEMFVEIGQIGLHSTENNAALWLHSGLNESKEVTDSVEHNVLLFDAY